MHCALLGQVRLDDYTIREMPNRNIAIKIGIVLSAPSIDNLLDGLDSWCCDALVVASGNFLGMPLLIGSHHFILIITITLTIRKLFICLLHGT